MKNLIESLKQDNAYRELLSVSALQKYIISGNKQYINFSSNDYLGLTDTELQKKFLATLDFDSIFMLGNPSSRLVTGNSYCYELLEQTIATLFQKPSSLVLSCGFMLNSGVLPALCQSDDLIIADKLVHASIIDGLKLCKCKWTRFLHNDMDSLEKILKKESSNYKNIYVVTESIFSMDGDVAHLEQIVELKRKYGFKIYLDEAHAFGVRGRRGCGVAEERDLLQDIDYLVVTMGKAIASQGAFIVCDSLTREVLINRMRTLIFSTAIPNISLLWSNFIISQLPNLYDKRQKLMELSTKLSTLVNANVNNFSNSSHIIPIVIGDNASTVKISKTLKELGYWVSAIRYPTVAKGGERLRISLTSAMDDLDIENLYTNLKKVAEENGIQL